MSLYKRKGSPFFWAKIYVPGWPKPHRFSTETAAKREALIKESDELRRLAGLPKPSKSGRALVDVATDFLEWRPTYEKKISGTWLDKIQDHLTRCIIPHFGATYDIKMMDHDALKGFKVARLATPGVGPGTVSKELSTLRQLLKYAKEEGIIETVPQVTNPPNKYHPKWTLLTVVQLKALLVELEKRKGSEIYPLELLRANTGLRPTEARRVRWEWIDWDSKQLRMPQGSTKNGDPRNIDLNEGALLALTAMKRGDESVGRIFSTSEHRAAWHNAVAAAGLGKTRTKYRDGRWGTSGVRPHDLRHTFATLLHTSGTPQSVIRDILGHRTMFMTNLYAHSFDESRKAAVNAVSIVPSVPKNVPKSGQKRAHSGTKGHQMHKAAKRESKIVSAV